jgi:hypothetical protein
VNTRSLNVSNVIKAAGPLCQTLPPSLLWSYHRDRRATPVPHAAILVGYYDLRLPVGPEPSNAPGVVPHCDHKALLDTGNPKPATMPLCPNRFGLPWDWTRHPVVNYLFNDAVSTSDYELQRRMIGHQWIMNWKGCERKRQRPNLRNYPDICLEQRNVTKILRTTDIRAKTWTRDFQNTNDCYSQCRDCRWVKREANLC